MDLINGTNAINFNFNFEIISDKKAKAESVSKIYFGNVTSILVVPHQFRRALSLEILLQALRSKSLELLTSN
jgi:hypothetical protein